MKCRKCKSENLNIVQHIKRFGLCEKCKKNQKWMRGEKHSFDDKNPNYLVINGPNDFLEESLDRIIKEKKDDIADFYDVTSVSGDKGEVRRYYFKVITETVEYLIFPEKCEHLLLYGKTILRNDNNIVVPSDQRIAIPLCEVKKIVYLNTYSEYKYSYESLKGYKGLTFEGGELYGANSFKYEIGKLYEEETINPYYGHYHEAYFHFCQSMEQVLDFRDYINVIDKKNKGYPFYKLFEIEASGHVVFRGKSNGVANQIRIIREVPAEEIITYFNEHKEYLKKYKISEEQWEAYQNEFKAIS